MFHRRGATARIVGHPITTPPPGFAPTGWHTAAMADPLLLLLPDFALIALGFKPVDADKGVRAALAKLGAGATADQLVKAALGR